MFLLPVSHEDSVIRRVPWVSIGIFGLCLLLQVHSCAVVPDIEARAMEVSQELFELQHEIIHDEVKTRLRKSKPKAKPEAEKAPHDLTEEELRGMGAQELMVRLAGDDSSDEYATLYSDVRKQLEAGTLANDRDERHVRLAALKAELADLEAKHPTMRFGYQPAHDGLDELLTSMFAHGGWLHLLGNMWFLYLVGCNLEDRWGRWQFASFYVIAGIVAALTFTALHRDEQSPLVGASGAVAGAMGAFMVCFAKTKVKIFYLYWIMLTPRHGTFSASAWLVAGLWLADQLLMMLLEIHGGAVGVAFSAHVGGFLFGAAVAGMLKYVGVDDQLDEAVERAADAATVAFQEHPLYLEAMDNLDHGDDPAARERLVALIAEQPQHVGAREALFNLGTRNHDVELLDYSVGFLLNEYARRDAQEPIVALFRQLRAAMPDYGLTDRELRHVATAAKHEEQPRMVIAAVTELLEQHPGSPVLPRTLLVASEVQARYASPAFERDTLERIVRRFPEHACAQIARERLATMEATT